MTIKTLRARLDRLDGCRAEIADQRMARRRDCRGLELNDILKRIGSAVPDGYDEFDERVGEQLTQWAQKGCDLQNPPGYYIWICGLQEGWLYLPEKIPLSLLQSFVELHPENTPLQRCEDCLLGLPANDANAWQVCPSCGGQRIYWADSQKPWGTYRPRTEILRALQLCKPDRCFIDEDTNYLGECRQARV